MLQHGGIGLMPFGPLPAARDHDWVKELNGLIGGQVSLVVTMLIPAGGPSIIDHGLGGMANHLSDGNGINTFGSGKCIVGFPHVTILLEGPETSGTVYPRQ